MSALPHDPIATAFEYLQARLGPTLGGLVTGTHEHPAPQSAAWPLVTWQPLDALDSLGTGTIRHLTVVEVLVRAAGRDVATSQLVPAAAAIDAALVSGDCATLTTGTVYGCVRLRPHRLVAEQEDGERITHLGGIYRITVGP
jgi:hypothetical protein